MSDNLADGGLIDVSALSLSELLEEVDESSLASALERILAAQQEEGHHGFNANI
jgi:FXSXX-COOH protein